MRQKPIFQHSIVTNGEVVRLMERGFGLVTGFISLLKYFVKIPVSGATGTRNSS
jgi:hypothetical protein